MAVAELWEVHDELAKVGLGSYAELTYLVTDVANEAAALAACAGDGTPGTYEDLPRRWRRIDSRVSDTSWKVRIRYEGYERQSEAFTFDTGSATEHVTQSISTIASYAASGYSAPNFGGAVNFDGERVLGVDIQVPAVTFSETRHLDPDDVDDTFRTTVADLAKRTNSAAFRGYEIGEVLFLNASIHHIEGEKAEVTFNFAVNRNRTGIQIGSITGIAKKGWEYLWTFYRDYEVEIATGVSYIIKVPVAVYVEQMYYAGDFSGLGLD